MNAKRNQAKLAKHLSPNHPALTSLHVNGDNLNASMSWYAEHVLAAEIDMILRTLDQSAILAYHEYLMNARNAAFAEANNQIENDPLSASECYLLYMVLAPERDHLPWLAQSASDLLRAGISHYQELMDGIVALHATRDVRARSLRELELFVIAASKSVAEQMVEEKKK
ncbi:hypothetical protein EOM33_03350 [Candidatus Saccharibacteria bacterium]|nr:hypothetical protein [Candidatus Saccharibacteria bacterium]